MCPKHCKCRQFYNRKVKWLSKISKSRNNKRMKQDVNTDSDFSSGNESIYSESDDSMMDVHEGRRGTRSYREGPKVKKI